MKVNPSMTLAITAKAKKMMSEGINVISLAAGEPDTLVPREVKEAAIKAVNENFNRYTPASGIDDLKQAIVQKFKRDNSLEYEKKNVVVSSGGKQSLFNCFFVLSPGEFIVPVPYWLTYPEQIKAVGSKPVFCETDNNEIKADLIGKNISDKTRAVILNSPNNPSGAVAGRAELQRIADLALEKDIWVISDEAYEYFIYDTEHVSIGSLNEEIKNKTLTINTISKSYSVPGWRIGYAAAPEELARQMSALQSHVTSGANSIAQKAAVRALGLGKNPEIQNEYKQRRDLMVDELKGMGLDCQRPQGAFYCWAKIDDDSLNFCSRLLEEAKVAAIPGEPFGAADHVRFSFAVSQENIREAMRRLRGFLDNRFLQNKNVSY